MEEIERYKSDLNDKEWSIVEPIIRCKRQGPKVREAVVRRQLDGIFYLLTTGCQWDMLPKCYGKHNTIHRRFARWRDNGMWEKVNTILREKVREKAGRNKEPSAAIIDSQSVKTVQKGGRGVMMLERKLRAGNAT